MAASRPWWKRALKLGFRMLLSLVLLALIGAFGGYIWLRKTILSQLPEDLSQFRDWRPPTTCQVYAADGEMIDEFSLERRFWLPLSEIPPLVANAFIAAEDHRFWYHHGVDVIGIARALVVNLQSGSIQQGGSTITQQLVKNLLVGKERSYERKLKEAALAWRLESELSKEQLLEMFLNYVYLGSGNYGVEAAARDYFGVSARELDAGQAALLAGMIPSPSKYSPRLNPALAAERRTIVLGRMAREGYVQPDEVAEYRDDPVVIPRVVSRERGQDASYVTEVRRELRRLLPSEVIFSADLRVYTALDREVQKVAEESIRQALADLDARQGRRGAVGFVPPEEREAWLRQGHGMPRDPETNAIEPPALGDCFEALVGTFGELDKLLAGPFSFSLRAEDHGVLVRPDEVTSRPLPLERRVKAGDVLRVCRQEGGDARLGGMVRLDPRPWGEGAAVVIENRTGRVVALVGGYEVGLEGFVRATQAARQPGSSFKPYVYAAALLGGKRQTDMVLDAPIAMPAGGGRVWSPKNYDGGYAGRLPMRTALAKSLNTVAVRLTLEAGTRKVAEVARSMGVRTRLRLDPTMALGSSEVTPMDQALGYATIARMGAPTPPVWIDRLMNSRGQELGRSGGLITVGGQVQGTLPGGALPRALPAGVAYELADMLREVVRAGTARKAYDPTLDRAGKTGTTNDFLDAWFVGFTPRHTIAVWIGSDTTTPLGDKETGGKTALPAWIRIAEALPHAEGERLPIPDEAMLYPVDGRWVGLARREGEAPPISEPLTAF